MHALPLCASVNLGCNFGHRAASRSRRSSRASRKTHISIAASFVKRTIVFDTGAIIRAARDEGATILVRAGCLDEVWRDGSSRANLARLMENVHGVPALDAIVAMRGGERLVRVSASVGPIDASVVNIACSRSPSVIATSDPNDMASLLASGPPRDVLVFSLAGGG